MQNRGERTHYYIDKQKNNYLNSTPTDLHSYQPGDEWHDRFLLKTREHLLYPK